MTNGNIHMQLWDSVQRTDPNYTKQFTRGGGFKGTSTNATYLAKRATETFGPCGLGWGITVLDEQLIEGHPLIENGVVVGHARIHRVHAKLWYVRDGVRGEIEQFGQTEMVGKNSRGYFTDEEAPKKSLTDAMTKCLSLLGFAADIHLGLYDDNKYVAELRQEFAQEPEPQPEPPPKRDLGPRLSIAQHTTAMKTAGDETALKRAFAVAWKQNEDPHDPSLKTPAQLKLKEVYDRALEALHDTAPLSEEESPMANSPFDEDAP